MYGYVWKKFEELKGHMTPDEVAALLTQIGCIKKGSFKLRSGKVISSYFDLRVLTSDPKALRKIAKQLYFILEKLDYDVIITIPTGGMVLAPILALLTNKPMGYIRKSPKRYGCQRQLEGVSIVPGQRVVLFDDLVGTGDTCVAAEKLVKSYGGMVKDVVVVVDRRLTPKKLLNKMRVHSLLSCENTYI